MNRVMISGGGTGGHIFPALAIADCLKQRHPHVSIRFVGALGRMEMQRVPAAGYPIKGLWISGIARKEWWRNFSFPFKVLSSVMRSYIMLRSFKPDVVIGTGGFASGPLLFVANWLGIPTLLQEQNSYPGITNKMLAEKADAICVAYDKLERWFPAEKTFITGNPIRKQLLQPLPNSELARAQWGLRKEWFTVLVLGGSLGAKAINEAIQAAIEPLGDAQIQILWQCGQLYYQKLHAEVEDGHVRVHAFISDMPSAYAAADLVVSRAGAGTLSELAVIAKPSILIPSPNVAEDHQTHNARALERVGGAVLLRESESSQLADRVIELARDASRLEAMSASLRSWAKPRATNDIVDHVERISGVVKSKPIFFMGIGGAGMSALAQHLHQTGNVVAGYDRTSTPVTQRLESLGIPVLYEEALSQLPNWDFSEARVIYTPAISLDQPLMVHFRGLGIVPEKRAKALAQWSERMPTFAVAGTHGKTTASAMLTHVLHRMDARITAFVGGWMVGFDSNYVHTGSDYAVIEADEFDRSFLHLHPVASIITSVDPDHLDIYASASDFSEAFAQFAAQVEQVPVVAEGVPITPSIQYGFGDQCGYQITALETEVARSKFILKTPKGQKIPVVVPMPGKHNAMNATGVLALLMEQGFDTHEAATAMESFRGIERRFQIHVQEKGRLYIDDYAHHPTAIHAILDTVMASLPKTPITVVFQPHLYSRTKDFLTEFAAALSRASRVYIAPIYPAREEPIPGITSEALAAEMSEKNAIVAEFGKILDELRASVPEVLITLGAGDISRQVSEFIKIMRL